MIKADGLAAGKGVTVAATVEEALAAVDDCFAGAFGAAGAEVVIEEFLVGEEASFFALSDGETVAAARHGAGPQARRRRRHRPEHRRHGRLFAGAGDDAGARRADDGRDRPADRRAPWRARGTPFRGVLYAGLMITADGPKLIEYNVRFGDPETQVLMLRLDGDLLELLVATAEGRLAAVDAALERGRGADRGDGRERLSRRLRRPASAIAGIDRANALPGVKVFHAGTALRDGELVADGGRVLNVTARGGDAREAQARAYAAVDLIDWPGRLLPERYRLARRHLIVALTRIPASARPDVLCLSDG